MVGYYETHKTFGTLLAKTKKEREMIRRTETMIGRIRYYIHRLLAKIGTVFGDFRAQIGEAEWDSFVNLVESTMGADGRTIVADNPATGVLKFEITQEEHAVSQDPESQKLKDLVGETMGLENRLSEISDKLSDNDKGITRLPSAFIDSLHNEDADIRKRLGDLERDIDALDGNTMDPLGLKRRDYAYEIIKLENAMGDGMVNQGGVYEIDRIIATAGPLQRRVIASYLMRRIHSIYEGRDGDFLLQADSAIQGISGFDPIRGNIKKNIARLAVGPTKSEHTWNSPFKLLTQLTTLVDNTMSTSAGHWGNIRGVPSIGQELSQIGGIVETISNQVNEIKRTISGPVYGAVDLEGLRRLDNPTKVEKQMEIIFLDILTLIEEPEAAKIKFNSEVLQKDEDLRKIATNIAANFINVKKHIEIIAEKSELIHQPFDYEVPYRLRSGLVTVSDSEGTPLTASFIEEMPKMIDDWIKKGWLHDNRVSPIVLYSAGLVPEIYGGLDIGLESTLRLKNEGSDIMNQIFILARARQLMEENPRAMDRDTALKKAREDGHTALSNRIAGADEIARGLYEKFVIPATEEYLNRAGSTKEGISNLSALGITNINNIRTKYEGAIRGGRPEHRRRLSQLMATEESKLVVRSDSPPFHIDDTRISRASQLLTRNVVYGAGRNVYFPQTWDIPPVKVTIENESIRQMIVTNPAIIMEGINRALGQNAVMKSMFLNLFNITTDRTLQNTDQRTPMHSMLNLFIQVFQESGANIFNDDGTPVGAEGVQLLIDSMESLKEKLDVVLGRGEILKEGDYILKLISKYSPDIVRTVFGTNLTMATLMVEYPHSVVEELFGRGSASGFITAALAPVLKLSPQARKIALRDHAHWHRSFTESRIPDYAKTSEDVRTTFRSKLPQWLGERNMWLAGQVHSAVANARSIIFRNWVNDYLISSDKLFTLQALMETAAKNKLIKNWQGHTGRKELQKLMGKAGIPKGDISIILFLKKNGAFESQESLKLMRDMIKEDINRQGEGEHYILGDMTTQLNIRYLASDEEFIKGNKLITILRLAESDFINEVLVSTNPFDVKTGMGSWDVIMETFRRHPVLYSSQQVLRRSGRVSPTRLGVSLLFYALFDMMYMSSLLLAAGYPMEDIIEGWRENPGETLAMTIARLPHFGRYMGVISDLMFNVLGMGYNTQPHGAISFAGATGFMRNLANLITAPLSDETEIDPRRMIMLARILPIIGGGLSRAAVFQMLGEDYQRQANRSSKATKPRHMNSFRETSNRHHIDLLRNVAQSAFRYNPNDVNVWDKLPPMMQQSLADQRQLEGQMFKEREEAAQIDSESPQPQAPPTPTAEPKAPTGPATASLDNLENQGLQVPEQLGEMLE